MTMVSLTLWLLCVQAATSAPTSAPASAAAAGKNDPRRAAVKIFTSQSAPNMFRPWEVRPPQETTGSGVILEGGRILTNAHVVKDAVQIFVQPNQSSERLDAEIEYFSEDGDLATLRLDDPSAIADRAGLSLADGLPKLQTKVEVLGYPTGGDTLSVTEGVVSRIEYANYYGDTGHLRIQVDAAINPGNSGGAAVAGGQVIGVVFSRLSQSDNIGYIIPAPVVRQFLADFESDKKLDGFPRIDLMLATLENPTIRRYLKLEREQTGVVIHRVNDPELQPLLKPWDIITACEGSPIDNLGMVSVEDELRIAWPYLVAKKAPGSKAKMSIIRAGKAMDIDIPTTTNPQRLIQKMHTQRPTYFIYGGIVFSPATAELCVQAGQGWMAYLGTSGRLITRRINEYRATPDFELVATCSPILPHKINKGYRLDALSIVTHVNDTPVKNLRHMIELIKANKEPFIIFRFEDEYEEKIVLDPKEVEANNAQILLQNNIPAACSADLRDLWPQ